MTPFQRTLLGWYRDARRDLPWRRTRDPYAIWIAETMLQQTTVAAVVPYWERWLSRFPDVRALAAAEEDEILASWSGLGYYRRARNLHAAARSAGGVLPTTSAAWRALPGVGAYTAAAVASIALGERVPLVDGNVERVYARLAGDDGTGTPRHRRAWEWAAANLADPPGDWNQALMELGATICRPTAPDCPRCPVRAWCRALAEGRTGDLPAPNPRPATIELAWSVLAAFDTSGRLVMERTPAGEWWAGMWRLPTVRGPMPPGWTAAEPIGIVRAAVTRHRIALHVYRSRAESVSAEIRTFEAEEIAKLAIPSPYLRAIRLAGGQEFGAICTAVP